MHEQENKLTNDNRGCPSTGAAPYGQGANGKSYENNTHQDIRYQPM